MSHSKNPEQLSSLFEPRNIAVVGASNIKVKWGYIVPANIVAGGYTGDLYPVNPREEEILERPVFRSVKDIPGEVDLAVVTVPAVHVNAVVRECVEKGVKSCIVISGGFSEAGGEGDSLERELIEIVRGSGMRLVGPEHHGGLLRHLLASRAHASCPPRFRKDRVRGPEREPGHPDAEPRQGARRGFLAVRLHRQRGGPQGSRLPGVLRSTTPRPR